jgi:hypothetical protein
MHRRKDLCVDECMKYNATCMVHLPSLLCMCSRNMA